MSSSDRNGRAFWTTAVVIICLDVATKVLAVRHLDVHMPLRVVGDVVRLTLAFNPGAAFSMSLGDYSRYIFGTFAIIALFILWRLYRTTASGDATRVLALGLAWGGAAGNLLDRFRSSRGVVDFIDIGVGDVRFWTFNVADSAVTIGALLLAWVLWQEDRAVNAAAQSAAATGKSASEGGEARSSS